MSGIRNLMPALANKVYFNYGGQGPLPSDSLEAIKRSWQTIQELGPFTNDVWPYLANEISSTKMQLAAICGVPAHRIALTENVTSGCVLPLWGLPFSTGDHLLISDCEHPGIVAACKELARRKNLKIDILPVQDIRAGVDEDGERDNLLLEKLETALTPKTRLVALSHLLWNTGTIMPITLVAERLSQHQNKPFLLVDAAQSFGQIEVCEEASKADIYAFTGHKWACGPEGLGGVAISERVLKESNPTLIGWRCLKQEGSIYDDDSNQFHLDSRRFEIATSCVPLLAGLRCSLALLNEEGTYLQRHKKIQNLSKYFWSSLKEVKHLQPVLNGYPPAGLVSFSINSKYSNKEIVNLLGRKGLWIRVLEDPIWLRACLHITTQQEEIEYLINEIKNLIE